MSGIVVLADEALATAFRLAGVDARSPAPAALAAAFEHALDDAALLVLTPAVAAALDPVRLAAAQRRERPLLAVLPEPTSPQPDAAFVRRMRAVLGIEG